ncbi:hypothetical protein QE366_000781 [Nocardioides zeae]|nr:hypothetical protein [Nocardioides zeae]
MSDLTAALRPRHVHRRRRAAPDRRLDRRALGG